MSPDVTVAVSDGVAVLTLNRPDRVDVINDAGERTASITLPAGSLPTNICIGGGSADELFVTAAHAESLLRIRLDERGDPPLAP